MYFGGFYRFCHVLSDLFHPAAAAPGAVVSIAEVSVLPSSPGGGRWGRKPLRGPQLAGSFEMVWSSQSLCWCLWFKVLLTPSCLQGVLKIKTQYFFSSLVLTLWPPPFTESDLMVHEISRWLGCVPGGSDVNRALPPRAHEACALDTSLKMRFRSWPEFLVFSAHFPCIVREASTWTLSCHGVEDLNSSNPPS